MRNGLDGIPHFTAPAAFCLAACVAPSWQCHPPTVTLNFLPSRIYGLTIVPHSSLCRVFISPVPRNSAPPWLRPSYSRAKVGRVPQLTFKALQYNAASRTAYAQPKNEKDQDSIFIITAPPRAHSANVTLSRQSRKRPERYPNSKNCLLPPPTTPTPYKTIANAPSGRRHLNPHRHRPPRCSGCCASRQRHAAKRISALIDDVQPDLYIEDNCNAPHSQPRFNYDRSTIIEERSTYSDLTSKIPFTYKYNRANSLQRF